MSLGRIYVSKNALNEEIDGYCNVSHNENNMFN